MLTKFSMILLASQLTTMVADTMPRFDIAKSCKAGSTSTAEIDRCMGQENRAHDQLQPEWREFSPVDKITCTKETSMDGTPSYVELLVCLEMTRDSKKLHMQ